MDNLHLMTLTVNFMTSTRTSPVTFFRLYLNMKAKGISDDNEPAQFKWSLQSDMLVKCR